MVPKYITRTLVLLLAVLVASPDADAQKKKKTTPKKTTKKAARPARAPAAAVPALSGTLEQRLATLFNHPVASGSTSSLQVVEVETGRVVGQRNADLPVAPASNLKVLTTAAGLDLLGADFKFRTTVAIRGEVDGHGTLSGDVKITGRGDPTIGGRFHDGKAASVLEDWADELKRAGVQTVAGDLILEYGYFDTEYVHPTWPVDQLVNWYEAPTAALSMQEGCVMVRVLPSRPGALATVQLEPPNTYTSVQNSCRTGAGGGVYINRHLGTNNIIVRGGVPARSGATEVFVTVENPLHYFANATHEAFKRKGLRINGQVRLVPQAPGDWKTVTEYTTPQTIVTYVINKKSQNHYAEQLLKTIGAEAKKGGSFAGGSAAISDWLTGTVGIPREQFTIIDGSGMSRFNRASAHTFIETLRYVWKKPYRHQFVSSMPYTGEPDSRLRRRLNRAPYARQVYAKTGYISGVIGLSGYVHAKSGKVYAFSFLFNRYRTGVFGVYNLQDAILKEIVDHG